jgi:probable DNA repair protein
LQKGTSQLPKVFSWKQYLLNTWGIINFQPSTRLISNIESRVLIAQSMSHLGQKVERRLLDEVIKNYDYCKAHLISLNELQQSHFDTSELFSAWIQDYQKNKLKQGLIDINDLSTLIINNDIKMTKPYIYGFKTLTPEQSQFLNTIGYQVLEHRQLDDSHANKTFKTTQDEIKSAAQWAKKIHASNPSKQIVVVSPKINELHYQFKSIFDQVFHDTLNETGQKSYNISLGLSLDQYPLIQHLLLILKLSSQLQKNRIETTTFNAVITSPYIASAKNEQSARALLVNKVLSLSTTNFKLGRVKEKLSSCPVLEQILNTICDDQNTPQQSHDQWLLSFNNHLQSWGFATDRVLNSSEYQLFKKYQQTSLGLNLLSQYSQSVNVHQALEDLKNWLSQVMFQAQSAKTPIQILGSLEAEGLYFDEAWVLGMTNDFLPSPLNSPRFIPFDIATNHQIPRSNYELIAQDAKDTLTNLMGLSDNVVFSYAQTHNENEQQSSPLIEFSNAVEAPTKSKITHVKTETLNDSQAPELSNKSISGGVSTLKDQMACAFKGFSHRLNTQHFNAPHIGLSRIEQGNIIHKVLEKIYQQILSLEQLLSYNDKDLTALIASSIDQELSTHSKSNFIKVERNRLLELVSKFIQSEKQRDEFKIISTEQEMQVNVAGLIFDVRLDRTDEMENGNRIIFDYKIGKTSVSDWCGDTIKDPQLPIYVLSNKTQGVCFIELASDKITYKGLSKDKDSLPKQSNKKTTCSQWDEQLSIWQEKISKASLDFQQGEAQVLPTKNACEYCEYDSLCRVNK